MSLADQQWCPTSVQVTVLQARGLRIKGKSGTNDAYAVMQMGKEKYQTSVVEKSVAPVWKEEASFDLPPLHQGGTERSTLHVHVLHRALVGPDKLLGQAVINLLQLSEDKSRDKTEWFKLLDKTGKADKDRGEVLLDIQFMRNNMTASMCDLSAAGKSRSRLGKFKDKVRGKKKETDSASNMVPSLTQVLTDSEDEANGDGEVAASKEGKNKKHKMKSFFSPKSNLQRNMSQSMSVLPAKNSSLSSSQSSGLNVDSSEGKKKFKFMIHKRSGSSDSKDSGHQKQVPVEQSNLCINGSHVYCEEPQPRASRIGSNFSLASSGHGSMEDVPENSPPSVDSLRAGTQYSAWTEEEEDIAEEDDENESRRMEDERMEEERRRKEEKELEKQAEEEQRQVEEEERRAKEERVKREEEDRMRREEEKRRQEEEERRRREEEEDRMRREEETRRQEEEDRMRREEEIRRQEEEDRMRREEEIRRQEEEDRMRREEEIRRQEEEDRMRREEEKKKKEEEDRMRREEEIRRQEEEEKIRIEEEKMRQEEEDRMKREEEKKRQEEEDRMRIEEERKRQEEEEAERVRRAEEEKRKERQRRQEEERALEALRVAEVKRRTEEEDRRRREEEEEEILRRQEEEHEKKRKQEKRKREEEEEHERLMEEERKRTEAEEKHRREEEEEKIRVAEERRRKEEEEERVRRQEELKEKRRLEEEERIRKQEEQRRHEEEERIRKEKQERMEEKRRRQEEEEEKARKETEEMERLAETRRREEQEKKRIEEEEKVRREEEEKIKREERAEKERKEEEAKRLEKERLKREAEEQEKRENKMRAAGSKPTVSYPAEVISTNPFDENCPCNPSESPSGPLSSSTGPGAQQRCQSGVSSVGSRTVSIDEKDLIGSQREKRPAPQPPGRNQTKTVSQKEQDLSMQQAHINKQNKDAKTVSVHPQRSVQVIAPLSRSPADTTKATTAKHSKRPAPSRPHPAEQQTSSEPKTCASSDRDDYSYNPFEDDEDELPDDESTSCTTGPIQWPPAASASEDSASQTKIKSSKTAHAPLPPAVKNDASMSTSIAEGGSVSDDVNVADKPVHVQESALKESQQNIMETRVKKEAPPVASRRLQPVKPLNPLEPQSVSGDLSGALDKTKVNDTGVKGPYSQLTRQELISLVLKQEKQLSERDKKISELEQYIDNLLVRVIEEQPSILMSMNSLKKAA